LKELDPDGKAPFTTEYKNKIKASGDSKMISRFLKKRLVPWIVNYIAESREENDVSTCCRDQT